MQMKKHRVVITGLGVTACNGIGIQNFLSALQQGKSGIKYWSESEKLNFRCQIGGIPDLDSVILKDYLPKIYTSKLANKAIIYACLSGLEAWKDAGMDVLNKKTDSDSGIIMGAGDISYDSLRGDAILPSIPIDRGDNRKLGSRTITECMNSGAAIYLNNILGFGNRILSNSSACITGSEAVLLGYEYLSQGKAKRMICGSTEGDGRYIWGAFDAMRVLCNDSNQNPEFGSRPMSSTSSGFVPSGGSGALVLETLESAKKRKARIYAEILGGHLNSGGMRNNGSMTLPNNESVVKCIRQAILSSKISSNEIDLISGHLTSTKGDPIEVQNWSKALDLQGKDFPYINTPKSMIGHSIGGAGSIELVACVLQMHHRFIHPNLNVQEIHPNIKEWIDPKKIPLDTIEKEVNTIIKANFGFGDVNCVLILKKQIHE